MDWGTHVVLAAKLLESCGLEKGAAIYSVIPVIDKELEFCHMLENEIHEIIYKGYRKQVE